MSKPSTLAPVGIFTQGHPFSQLVRSTANNNIRQSSDLPFVCLEDSFLCLPSVRRKERESPLFMDAHFLPKGSRFLEPALEQSIPVPDSQQRSSSASISQPRWRASYAALSGLSSSYCFACIMLMVCGNTVFSVDWKISSFVSIYPLAVAMASHFAVPVLLHPALVKFTW